MFFRYLVIVFSFANTFNVKFVHSHLKDLGELRGNWSAYVEEVENRIAGGDPTTLTEYPFNVKFYNLGGMCGAVILSSKIVLTAAHCFDANRNIADMKIVSSNTYYLYIIIHIDNRDFFLLILIGFF